MTLVDSEPRRSGRLKIKRENPTEYPNFEKYAQEDDSSLEDDGKEAPATAMKVKKAPSKIYNDEFDPLAPAPALAPKAVKPKPAKKHITKAVKTEVKAEVKDQAAAAYGLGASSFAAEPPAAHAAAATTSEMLAPTFEAPPSHTDDAAAYTQPPPSVPSAPSAALSAPARKRKANGKAVKRERDSDNDYNPAAEDQATASPGARAATATGYATGSHGTSVFKSEELLQRQAAAQGEGRPLTRLAIDWALPRYNRVNGTSFKGKPVVRAQSKTCTSCNCEFPKGCGKFHYTTFARDGDWVNTPKFCDEYASFELSGCMATRLGGWYKPTEPLATGPLSHDDMRRLLPTFNDEHGTQFVGAPVDKKLRKKCTTCKGVFDPESGAQWHWTSDFDDGCVKMCDGCMASHYGGTFAGY